MRILTMGIAAIIALSASKPKQLDYEIFSDNAKVGVARYYVADNYINGVKYYAYLGKTVIDSVSGMLDEKFRPVRTHRHELVDLKFRGSWDYSSDAYYLEDEIQISLGNEDTTIHLDEKLPIVDFDLLLFQLPHIFPRLKSGDSAAFYLVLPMGKRVERCVAKVGKGEIVYFGGDTLATLRIYFTRPGYKSPISLWITPDLTPIRYYDAASGYQMFLVMPQQPAKLQDHDRSGSGSDSKVQ